MEEFHKVRRLPPYVFEQVNRLKASARARGAPLRPALHHSKIRTLHHPGILYIRASGPVSTPVQYPEQLLSCISVQHQRIESCHWPGWPRLLRRSPTSATGRKKRFSINSSKPITPRFVPNSKRKDKPCLPSSSRSSTIFSNVVASTTDSCGCVAKIASMSAWSLSVANGAVSVGGA